MTGPVAVEKEPEVYLGDVRLNLGCNQNPRKGYINVDVHAFPGVDVIADLEKRWPWEDGTVDEVSCSDLPEHLRMWWEEPSPNDLKAAKAFLNALDEEVTVADLRCSILALISALQRPQRTYGVIHFMNEANRVLRLGGRLDVTVPTSDGRGWAQDPTHVSFWNENTFQYFVPGKLRDQYPHLIQGNWKPIHVATSIPNAMRVTWVRAIMEKA